MKVCITNKGVKNNCHCLEQDNNCNNSSSTSTREKSSSPSNTTLSESLLTASENRYPLESQQKYFLKEFSDKSAFSGGSCSGFAGDDVALRSTMLFDRQKLGTIVVLLPEGTVIQCDNAEDSSLPTAHPQLSSIVEVGSSLLTLLHGRGAQTLLLNAFCGQRKRRMYARLKWEPNVFRACEFSCEFHTDSQNPARRIANIQVFCVQTAYCLSRNPDKDSATTLFFTTRHNSSRAIIFMDSVSIPLLGHFPSEVTGRSLYSIVHPDDFELIEQAHRELHKSGGKETVQTKNLRLVAYNGDYVSVNTEWAAFYNPWTTQLEMIVGRHCYRLVEETKTMMAISSQRCIQKFETQQGNESILQINVENRVQNKNINKIPIEEQEIQLYGKDVAIDDQKNVVEDTSQIFLTYSQINCLENVHRLLKSQSGSPSLDNNSSSTTSTRASGPDTSIQQTLSKDSNQQQQISICHSVNAGIVNSQVPTLTRQILQEHNKHWERECKDNWRRRLAQKRATQSDRQIPAAKTHQNSKKPRSVEAFSQILNPPPSKRFCGTSLLKNDNETLNLSIETSPTSELPSMYKLNQNNFSQILHALAKTINIPYYLPHNLAQFLFLRKLTSFSEMDPLFMQQASTLLNSFI